MRAGRWLILFPPEIDGMAPLVTPETTGLDTGALLTGLGGGLALFLFGMRLMTDSLKTVAGSSMKGLLARLTANRYTAALAGAIVTAVVQSSSVTAVLVVGFVSSGLLTLGQSIGVIIGANVGTTITAQIIAFQVYKYGLVMIALGFLTEVLAKSERARQWGTALMGLGLVFFGMELMSNATGPLKTWPPFLDLLQNMQQPLLGILAGALFTAVVQSSSATTGIVIVLASQGLLSLEAGIGLCLGANIGTCATALISSIGRSREAIQAAWVHVLFNVAGVAMWMFFIPSFAELIRAISPVSANLEGAERLLADTPRQIANAHTLFNVGNALIFIWLTEPLARLVTWWVPAKPKPEPEKAQFLDELYLAQPALALDQVRRELVHLATLVQQMLKQCLPVVTQGGEAEIRQLADSDDQIDELHGEIITYLGALSQKDLIPPQPQTIHEFVGIANYLENIGDVVDKNLLQDAKTRNNRNIHISSSTLVLLKPIEEQVLGPFAKMLHSLETGDRQSALEVIESKETINQLAAAASDHLALRLVASEPNRLATFRLETDVIEDLKRLNTLIRRIARLLLMEERSPDPAVAVAAEPQQESSKEPAEDSPPAPTGPEADISAAPLDQIESD